MIDFNCKVCGTRLSAPEKQVGRTLTCPDCQVPATVPEPPKPLASQMSSPGEYEMAETASGRAAGEASGGLFPVYCGLCGTLMHATPQQVGQKLTCPDCQTTTVVPPPPMQVPNPATVAAETERGYVVRDEADPAPQDLRSIAFQRLENRAAATEERALETDKPDAENRPIERPVIPRWPQLSGLFTFLRQPSLLAVWARLAIWAAVVLGLGSGAASLAAGAANGVASAGPWILGMLGVATAGVLGMAWLAVAAIYGLTILSDTAAGNERVENWPELGLFVDWIGDVLYVTNSLFYASLVTAGLAWLLDSWQIDSPYVLPPVLAVLFPLVLLSMLEASSRVVPYSHTVFRSLVRRPFAWLLFFSETAVLLALANGVVVAGAAVGAATAAVAAALAAMVLVYFWLLGRLALCIESDPEDEEAWDADEAEEEE